MECRGVEGKETGKTGSGSEAWTKGTKGLRTQVRTTLKKLPLKGELDTV
jgi:hypothetical protein